MESTQLSQEPSETPPQAFLSSLYTIFEKRVPKIGIDKKLKTVLLEKKETLDKVQAEPTVSQIDCEVHSLKIFEKYRNKDCLIVYSDNPEEKKRVGTKISFDELVYLVQNDFTVIENFIDSSKGEWVQENERSFTDDISFDSLFEQGNLRMAIKVNENEYDLIMRKDYNNEKNYSWFFFEVFSKVERNITFNIINFSKKKLLFSNEARVLVYNNFDYWSRNTYNVYYYQNEIPMVVEEKPKEEDPEKVDKLKDDEIENVQNFYTTLTFSYKISKELIGTPIYFSYCYPYTYTMLQNFLHDLSTKETSKSFVKFSTLTNTLCGNPIDVILISNWNIPKSKKGSICFTARVHPGESNSSYVIESVINCLLEPESEQLRDQFVFKIIPMLNPDGVINGNYRNNILGKDLNRLWMDPRTTMCPTIYYSKLLIAQSNPEFYCDFHGHSSTTNCCLYCCNPIKNTKLLRKKNYRLYEERVFTKLFEEESHYFNKQSCRFAIAKSKIRTARAVMYNELLIPMSYGFETSTIAALVDGTIEGFSLAKYNTVGKDFVNTLIRWSNKDIFGIALKKVKLEVEEKKKKKVIKKKCAPEPNLVGKGLREDHKHLSVGLTTNELNKFKEVSLGNKRPESEGKELPKKSFLEK